MKYALAALLLAFAAASCGAPQDTTEQAAPAPAAGVEVRDAWAAPTPGGVAVSAGYLTIANGGAEADALIGASSPRAGHVEIHEMVMEGDVMRMRPLPRLDIPAGGEASLAPGGAHLMFMDVIAPFAEGESVDVTLTFERAGDVALTLPVRRNTASSHGAGH